MLRMTSLGVVIIAQKERSRSILNISILVFDCHSCKVHENIKLPSMYVNIIKIKIKTPWMTEKFAILECDPKSIQNKLYKNYKVDNIVYPILKRLLDNIKPAGSISHNLVMTIMLVVLSFLVGIKQIDYLIGFDNLTRLQLDNNNISKMNNLAHLVTLTELGKST